MHRPTCYPHRDRVPDRVTLECPMCRRIRLEQRIVRKTVTALLAAGYRLATDQGTHDEAERRPETPTADRDTILAEMMETDDEFLLCYLGDETRPRWVRFVYGSDGYDVINDYTTSLETVLAPIHAYCDSYAG